MDHMNVKALIIYAVIFIAAFTQWHSLSESTKDVAFYLIFALMVVQGNWLMWRIRKLEEKCKRQHPN
ncbi:Uncharacterised protein [BD1-7 clade bacterium]|uniref:Uncharacterized protein n=1 Tax=BD1-7 clade bacterium TaxID=2029982 RepID=A0A5S9PFB5_9GAMM|nr:Uncharacterised protein [BD1-7 clade bacterium]